MQLNGKESRSIVARRERRSEMKKRISEIGPTVSKSLLALGGIKKSLDAPIKDIGNFIEVVKVLFDEDPSNIELKELLSQLNSIVAYVGGAGSDLFNLQSKLRRNRDITTKLDANLEKSVAEAKLRLAIRQIIRESLKK